MSTESAQPEQGSSEPAVHEQLRPFAWLIGTWVGVGVVGYPTMEESQFGQEISFSHDGRPFLTYWSRSWLLDADGERVRPSGTESGFWRPRPDNKVEVLLAQPTGYAEVYYGDLTVTGMADARITGARVELHTDVVARTESAKEYTGGTRLYGLVDGDLLWRYDMTAVGEPLTAHLSARLQKAQPA
jgi:hypothetical protein